MALEPGQFCLHHLACIQMATVVQRPKGPHLKVGSAARGMPYWQSHVHRHICYCLEAEAHM